MQHPPPLPPAPIPGPVHDARSGSLDIAYKVSGDDPIDLVFVMGWVSHLEYFWKAGYAEFREWWASYLRMGASPAAAVGLTRMNAEIRV
jgi:hypothetical protein